MTNDSFDVYRTRAWAEIDLDALLDNAKTARAALRPGTRLCAVVKANAYGHGAAVIAPFLEREGGADAFAVATADEALALRGAGVTLPVLILGYTAPSRFPALTAAGGILPAVWRAEDARALAAAGEGEAACFLALDSGMGRIGLSCDAAGLSEAKRIAATPGLRLAGVFSHFAMADVRDKTDAAAQEARFAAFCLALGEAGVRVAQRSLFNSAAIADGAVYTDGYELARQGITLYGLHPSPEVDSVAYRPVMSLHTRVVHVKTVPAGTGISYGHTFVTDRETRVATLSAGYADGWPRLLSGQSELLLRGLRCPQIGRVCMDMMMADVTGVPEADVGDEVLLFGGESGMTADECAERIGTIGYELVCGVSHRVPRIFVRGGRDVAVLV